MAPRFECVRDPSDLHEVWDNERDLPVVVEGRLLAYATRSRAEWMAGLLNAGSVEHCRQPTGAGSIRSAFLA